MNTHRQCFVCGHRIIGPAVLHRDGLLVFQRCESCGPGSPAYTHAFPDTVASQLQLRKEQGVTHDRT